MATTKTPTKPPAIPTVAEAEQTVSRLQEQRERLVADRQKAENETGKHAYGAWARGDVAAVAELDKVADVVMRHDQKLREIDHALATAARFLQEARQAEAAEQDRAAALKLREVVADIGNRMRRADKYLAAAADELNAAQAELDQLHALGCDFPTWMQVKVNAERAVQTMVMALPKLWVRDWIPFLAPGERRTFFGFWSKMAGPIEQRIKARLGEAEEKEVA